MPSATPPGAGLTNINSMSIPQVGGAQKMRARRRVKPAASQPCRAVGRGTPWIAQCTKRRFSPEIGRHHRARA